MLAIESFANCLLSDLNLSGKYAQEIDKLGPIAKVETFLRENDEEGFDRGCKEVQQVSELVGARNDYVHPKGSNLDTSLGRPKDQSKYTAIPMDIQGSTWPVIGIQKQALFWSSRDSKLALKAISDFFRYVAVDMNGVESQRALEVFGSTVDFGEHRILSTFHEFKEELRLARAEGFDFSFLGISEEE